MREQGRGAGLPVRAVESTPAGCLKLGVIVRVLCMAMLLLYSGPMGRAVAADQAIHLIMVEEAGCRFCRQWEADIGHAYSQTPEGRFAPIRRVKRDADEVRGLKPIVYTPTFIVMRGSEEVGRVTGYPGKDYFWPELDEILSGVGFMRGL